MALLFYNRATGCGALAQDLHRSGRPFQTKIGYERFILIKGTYYVYYSYSGKKRRKKFANYY